MSGQSDRVPDPVCENFYEADTGLRNLLARQLDSTAADWARPRLERMGRLAATEVDALAFEADRNPPRLEAYDRRGERTERIVLHPAYERLKVLSYGEGVVADYYDPEVRRVLGRHLHRVKFAVTYLFAQSEQGLYCPICMTDGAARLVEKFGDATLKAEVLSRLASKPPGEYWQGAMFLTEKQGGSDVGSADTIAQQVKDGTWRLTGDKWFCSNAETDVAMVLARPNGAPAGTKGLGLFALPRRRPDGSLNPWRVLRLKDKLGTRSMPTGEVRLEGAFAWAVGAVDRGFTYMTEMLNLSRLYNAVASVALVRRAVREAALYAGARRAFGRAIASYPLVQETLVGLSLELEGAMAFAFETAGALDRLDTGDANARPLLRILTPLVKLWTAKLAVRAASESLELVGGNGYIEDRVLARLYRDAQVLPIWEGTTNVLTLDCFRAIAREGALDPFVNDMARRDGCWKQPFGAALEAEVRRLADDAREIAKGDGEGWTLAARPWCERAARVYQAVLLGEAAANGGEREAVAARGYFARFIERREVPSLAAVSEEFRLLV